MAGLLEAPVAAVDTIYISNAEDFTDLGVDDVVGLNMDVRITSISHDEAGWHVSLEVLSREVRKDARNMEEASIRTLREFERAGGIVPLPG